MLALSSVGHSLEIVLDDVVTTNELPWVVSYLVIEKGTFRAKELVTVHGLTNGTTPVEMVPAPAADEVIQLKHSSVFNADTASATPIIRLDDATTKRTVAKHTLAADATLTYFEGKWS